MKRKLADALLILIGVAAVLLAFLALLSAGSAEQDTEAATAQPTPLPCAEVVALALPKPTAVPEPTTTPEPDKPAYNPAVPLPEDLQVILWTACEKNGADPALALGVIEVESGFDPGASNGLCYGLMQLNRKYFPGDLTPGENIRYGVEYLGRLLARYDTVEAALTAYNAGHDTGSRAYANTVLTAAERWRDIVWTR